MMNFKVKTAAPKGRGSWPPELMTRVQENLFATVALLVAASPDAEDKLMDKIRAVKGGAAVGAA